VREACLEVWMLLHSHWMSLWGWLILEHELRRHNVELRWEDWWSTRRRPTVVDVWWLDVGKGRWYTHVWRYLTRLSGVLIVVLRRICCKVDKTRLPVSRWRQLWPVSVYVGWVTVRCMLRVWLLRRRAATILKMGIHSPPASHHCISRLAVWHYRGNAVALRKMLQYHPRCSNVVSSFSRVAQILLEDDLRIELPISLKLRGPVLYDLFVGIVQGDLIRVGANRIVH
jgi:hypothetical protein